MYNIPFTGKELVVFGKLKKYSFVNSKVKGKANLENNWYFHNIRAFINQIYIYNPFEVLLPTMINLCPQLSSDLFQIRQFIGFDIGFEIKKSKSLARVLYSLSVSFEKAEKSLLYRQKN